MDDKSLLHQLDIIDNAWEQVWRKVNAKNLQTAIDIGIAERGNDILILIPTLNEAEAIGATIDDVKKYVDTRLILVLDGHSSDGTKDIALDRGALVMDVPKGKGRAFRTSLPLILNQYDFKWLIMLDGDYTYPAKHIPDIIAQLRDGADVVMGYRKYKMPMSMSKMNAVGNWGLSVLASILYWCPARDLCTGMWGFRKRALKHFNITSNRFTLEADLFANAVTCGCDIEQIPIEYRARLQGSDTKLKIKDGLEIGWFLIKYRMGA